MERVGVFSIVIDVGFILLGLTLLVLGGELLVRGAAALAVVWGLSPAVIGLTIVAAGTSMPELVVSLTAAAEGVGGIAIGNVVGSNIFNIGVVLGVSAVIRPLRIAGGAVRFEWPVLLLVSVQLHLLARDGSLDRLEGGFLFASLLAFVSYSIWIARKNISSREREEFEASAADLTIKDTRRIPRWVTGTIMVAAGVGLLAVGADALLRGSVALARDLGVSETVIGLTIVGCGTSTPELITSVVAVLRGRDDIAVTNVIGSNIFNVLGICGIAALVSPVSIPPEILTRDNAWMIGLALCLFPLMRSGMTIVRFEGLLLLAAFLTYTGLLLR